MTTANLPRPSSVENVSTTLASGITDVATTATVSDASNLAFPCYLVIDRVDSAGTQKATSLWEYIKVTNIAGNDLTISRGQNGSTQQAHSSGAVVEAVITSAMFEDWYNALNTDHAVSGGHVMATPTIVYGQIFQEAVTSIASIARAEFTTIALQSTASVAVPEFGIKNVDGHIFIKPGVSKALLAQLPRQDNTTNSYDAPTLTQYGWSFTSGASSTAATRIITFPVQYSAAPVIHVNPIGVFGPGSLPSTVASWITNTANSNYGKAEAINSSVTGFTLAVSSDSPQTIGLLFGASWMALGKI